MIKDIVINSHPCTQVTEYIKPTYSYTEINAEDIKFIVTETLLPSTPITDHNS